ncbi:MAG: hypothetical protein IBJ17_14835 [Reyranella sp.]|nr:hypothetical protein [Reyranella sp.]
MPTAGQHGREDFQAARVGHGFASQVRAFFFGQNDEVRVNGKILGGGDDYELVIAVPPRRREALLAAARAAKVKMTRLGRFIRGEGVRLTFGGKPAPAPRKGYVHF